MESAIHPPHQQPDSDDDCSLCVSIKDAVGERGTDFYGHWIWLDKTVDRPCHQHLLHYMRDAFSAHRLVTLHGGRDHGAELRGHIRSSDGNIQSNDKLIRLLKNGSTAGASELFPDKDWVDLDRLRRWKTECLTTHGQHCCNPLNRSRVTPAWLIDTLHGCLVPGDSIENFVALSYVWGAAPCLRTERAILQLLEQPGALSQEPFSSKVSPMIRHSVALIRAMGERYLWADALCIVQDDAEQTAHQLRLMGDIYASAMFTIVATDEDASGGIPGIQGVSRPRNLHRAVLPFASEEKLLVQDKPFFPAIDDPDYRYFTRAWTYQEYAMSQRLLVVGRKQFHWMCSSAAFREDTVSSCPELRGELYHRKVKSILSGHPHLGQFMLATRDYNGRHHSFPEDALAGFSGILEIFQPAFEGGFIYGLPLMYFHAALMWRSMSPVWSQRRRHSGKQHSILQGSLLPSWSWLGWIDGELDWRENTGELDSIYDATFGLAQWYSHETPTSTDRRAIGPCYPGVVVDVEDDTLDSPLARGWTRDTYDPEVDGIRALVRGVTIYRHESMPKYRFWRWFPIKNPLDNLTTITCPQPQHAFISCRTQRAWFRVRTDVLKYTDKFAGAEVYGIDQDICGWLQATSYENGAELPSVDSGQYGLVELVAICLKKPAGIGIGTYFGPRDNIEKIGVLWVEWVDGVAYRKGVGEINKDNWESHNLEDVDLILG